MAKKDTKKFEEQIQALIDSFPEDQFVELLEEMIDRAQTALDAWNEEHEDEEE